MNSGNSIIGCGKFLQSSQPHIHIVGVSIMRRPLIIGAQDVRSNQYDAVLGSHGFGESEIKYGGSENNRYQGLCQGNGAFPAGWSVISAAMIALQRRNGHSIMIKSELTGDTSDYCAILFVDDTDLPCMSISAEEDPRQTTNRLQRAVTDWANRLRVTGGALKPDNPKKCF